MSTIQYNVFTQDQVNQFYISIISCTDDIIEYKLNTVVYTKEEYRTDLQSLKLPSEVTVTFVTEEPTEQSTIIIPTSTIILPHSIKHLIDSESTQINEENEHVYTITPDSLQSLLTDMSTSLTIPKQVLYFKESDILPQEHIISLMKLVYNQVFHFLCTLEDIHEKAHQQQSQPQPQQQY